MLHGVPVVAGVQYAPVIRPGRLPVARRREGSARSTEADRPAEARPLHRGRHRGRRPAAGPRGARDRRGVGGARRDRRRWRRTGPGWAPPRSASRTAPRRSRAVVAAVDQFVDMFTQLGGLMAERVTDLRDIRDRVIAELSGLPEPGVPLPDVPSILLRRGPRARRHRGPGPDARRRPGHHAGRPDQPHRDHRPAARASRASSPSTDSTPSRAGTMVLVDGTRGTVTVSPGRRPPQARPSPRRSARPSCAARWTGPGATADGHAVAVLANVQDGAAARAAPRDPGRGRRAVPHRTVLPQPRHRTERRRAGRRSTPRCSRRSRAARS